MENISPETQGLIEASNILKAARVELATGSAEPVWLIVYHASQHVDSLLAAHLRGAA